MKKKREEKKTKKDGPGDEALLWVHGYRVVSVAIQDGTMDDGMERFVYLRKHQGSEPAVFMANVKEGITEDDVRECLRMNGVDLDAVVEAVTVGSLRGGQHRGWFARVVFSTEEDVQAWMNKVDLDLRVVAGYEVEMDGRRVWSHQRGVMGLDGILERYRGERPGAVALRKWSAQVMAEYDKKEEEEKQKEKEVQIDEDGFVLVQSRGRRRGTVRDPSGASVGATTAGAGLAAREKRILKKKRKREEVDLDDFYGFKRKEEKRTRVIRLREQFQTDQKRLRAMSEAYDARAGATS